MDGGRLRIIAGPTAAGKSSIAQHLAENSNAAIVSADSRQIYRGFDIGTAKPTVEERSRAPHFGIDVADPIERYSAARWAAGAREWIATARESGRLPVIVGGTGLYIRALVDPLFSAPELDPARRRDLERELDGASLTELRRWCRSLDPERAHLGRAQLVRAIETALLAGVRISELHRAHREASLEEAPSKRLSPSYLVVDPEAALHARIESRVRNMIERGWAEEVSALARSIPPDAPAWNASGYGAMLAVTRHELDLSSATERVIIETRQYAKRQRTWFRHQLPAATVTRVNPNGPRAGDIVHEWWERAE